MLTLRLRDLESSMIEWACPISRRCTSKSRQSLNPNLSQSFATSCQASRHVTTSKDLVLSTVSEATTTAKTLESTTIKVHTPTRVAITRAMGTTSSLTSSTSTTRAMSTTATVSITDQSYSTDRVGKLLKESTNPTISSRSGHAIRLCTVEASSNIADWMSLLVIMILIAVLFWICSKIVLVSAGTYLNDNSQRSNFCYLSIFFRKKAL